MSKFKPKIFLEVTMEAKTKDGTKKMPFDFIMVDDANYGLPMVSKRKNDPIVVCEQVFNNQELHEIINYLVIHLINH